MASTRCLRETTRYLDPASRSRQRLTTAAELMPDGITRETIRRPPLAPWVARAHGSQLVDVDGDERTDFVFNHTALVHGHTYGPVVKALTEQVRTLEAVSFPNEHEAELAGLLAPRVPIVAPHFRFVSSGSEAVLLGLRLAQAATGRRKVVIFEHCYHGGFVASSNTAATPSEHLICPFGNQDRLRRIFTEHGAEIAAVLADLCPVRGALSPASEEFAEAIAEECARYGTLLVADEVVSSRTAPGGIASQYGLTADIVCLGKYIGGGLPIGAVAFRRDLGIHFAPDQRSSLGHGGTYNGNPLTMLAGSVALRALDASCVARLDSMTGYLCDELLDLFSRRGSGWTVRCAGSVFHFWPYRELPRSPSDARQQGKARADLMELSQFLLHHGVIIAPSGFGCLATVSSSADIDSLMTAMDAYLLQ